MIGPNRVETVRRTFLLASGAMSVCAAVFIFAVSLPFYAAALAEWAQGNLEKSTVILGPFLSISSIAIVAIQAIPTYPGKFVRIIRAILGGIGSLTLAVFVAYFCQPLFREPNAWNFVYEAVFVVALAGTLVRTFKQTIAKTAQ